MQTLEYIDSYFKGDFTPKERMRFEKRISDDPEFAEEVAFYLSVQQTAKEEFIQDKKREFREMYQKNPAPAVIRPFRQAWAYVAAAAVIAFVVLGAYLFFRPAPQKELAENYIRKELADLNTTMATTKDSIQTSLDLYNHGKYNEALVIMEKVISSDTSNFTAKKYAGVMCLRLQDYDRALAYFRQLQAYQLYSNPGKFYEALTLMQRNRPEDEKKIIQILQEVVRENLEGKETAEHWLDKL